MKVVSVPFFSTAFALCTFLVFLLMTFCSEMIFEDFAYLNYLSLSAFMMYCVLRFLIIYFGIDVYEETIRITTGCNVKSHEMTFMHDAEILRRRHFCVRDISLDMR